MDGLETPRQGVNTISVPRQRFLEYESSVILHKGDHFS